MYAFLSLSDEAFGLNVEAQRDLKAALRDATVAGAPVRLTGYDALVDSTGEAEQGTGVLLEAVLGGVGALLVLIFVFGSWLALVPLAMAISSVLVSFLLLWGLTTITDVSPIVQFLVALIGLGVSIDYALLIVVRWREEREKGLEDDEAVAAAMATAERAVVFSGTTVAFRHDRQGGRGEGRAQPAEGLGDRQRRDRADGDARPRERGGERRFRPGCGRRRPRRRRACGAGLAARRHGRRRDGAARG